LLSKQKTAKGKKDLENIPHASQPPLGVPAGQYEAEVAVMILIWPPHVGQRNASTLMLVWGGSTPGEILDF